MQRTEIWFMSPLLGYGNTGLSGLSAPHGAVLRPTTFRSDAAYPTGLRVSAQRHWENTPRVTDPRPKNPNYGATPHIVMRVTPVRKGTEIRPASRVSIP